MNLFWSIAVLSVMCSLEGCAEQTELQKANKELQKELLEQYKENCIAEGNVVLSDDWGRANCLTRSEMDQMLRNYGRF